LFGENLRWVGEVDRLMGEVRGVREERDGAVRGVRDGEGRLGDKVKEFEGFVVESRRQKEFAERKIEKLSVDVEKKTKRGEEMAGNLARLEKENSDLKNETDVRIQGLLSELEELENNLSKSHVQIENLTSDNQSLSERVGKSELRFAIASENHRKKVNGLQNELSGLQDINAQKEALASDLRQQLVQNDLKYNSVESQLSSTTKNLQTRVQDLEAKISESNLTVNRKNSDLREQSDFTQEIQKSNFEITEKLEKSKEEILQLSAVVANNQTTRSELESVVASQKNQIKDSQRALEAEQTTLVSHRGKISELETANGKLEDEKKSILGEMDILNSELVEKFIGLSQTIEEQNLLVNA
jgi:chromosome segregation ATPase